jgi:redox-sensitive bicupin YhaK (pirin superfamily)
MSTSDPALLQEHPVAHRRIIYRTRGGRSHGPITRLMSPSDLGEYLKPFVFLDRLDGTDMSRFKFDGFGLHPHSGIATLTWLFEGWAHYEDNLGRRGKLDQGWMEWMHAGGGAWHGGNFGDADRLRGFQLWVALPAAAELGEAYSRYVGPQSLSTAGPVTVLLGQYGEARGAIEAPSPVNYFSVRLKAGESWLYEPPARHSVAFASVSMGSLQAPEAIGAGELVAFAHGEEPIHFRAPEDTEFVFGSAARHPHDLVLGYYSVHTSEAALAQGEAQIRQIGQRLRAQGRA